MMGRGFLIVSAFLRVADFVIMEYGIVLKYVDLKWKGNKQSFGVFSFKSFFSFVPDNDF